MKMLRVRVSRVRIYSCVLSLSEEQLYYIIFAPSARRKSPSESPASTPLRTCSSPSRRACYRTSSSRCWKSPKPPRRNSSHPSISPAKAVNSRKSNVGCNPLTLPAANAMASLHTLSSCFRHRTMHWKSCTFCALRD